MDKQIVAIGSTAVAKGDQSTAIGNNVFTTGNSSIAIGGDDLDSVAFKGTAAEAWGAGAKSHEYFNNSDVAIKYHKKTGQ